jgi:hypothetical protein
VQVVEFLCTSGFPALFTRILTLRQLDTASYYGYLLLYNAPTCSTTSSCWPSA